MDQVRVFDLDKNRLADGRLEACDGMIELSRKVARRRLYRDGAILPVGPWRSVYQNESVDGESTRFWFDPFYDIGVFAVPSEIVGTALEKVAFILAKEKRPIRFRQETLEDARVIDIVDYCVRLFEGLHPTSVHSVKVDAPDQETVTINSRLGVFEGMHLDLWTGAPASPNRRVHVRFVVNLGPVERYLLFSPIRGIAPEIASTVDAKEALERFRDRARASTEPAILRVKLSPGEAYSANTEVIVHDGSSSGTNRCCASLHIRCERNARLA